jgi:hypothetical protein
MAALVRERRPAIFPALKHYYYRYQNEPMPPHQAADADAHAHALLDWSNFPLATTAPTPAPAAPLAELIKQAGHLIVTVEGKPTAIPSSSDNSTGSMDSPSTELEFGRGLFSQKVRDDRVQSDSFNASVLFGVSESILFVLAFAIIT